ncbi:hypothetical protein KSP39_PZI020663 [Platanthera zijinensis]|uniref:Late embryogenesis abundant protein LEA-2 subgroup domain-containing protein n=1 Tax=Platanthera zijinensis TaxID=2320716 RepID=A0AAP0B086_9ASPA
MSKQYAGDGHLRPPHAQGHHQLAGPSSSSAQSFSGECCSCLCCCLSLIVIALLLFVFFFFFKSEDTSPYFQLQHVDVENLLIEPNLVAGGAAGIAPPSSAVYLSLNITLRFSWANPHMAEILYGASNLCILYGGEPLGTASVPGFLQPANRSRLVDFRVSVSRFNILQVNFPDLNAAVNDIVQLSVTADFRWKIRVHGVTYPSANAPVDCLLVLSPRSQSLIYKEPRGNGKCF